MAERVPGGGVPVSHRAGLPAGPPYFAGRRRELADLRADIDRPGLDALRGLPSTACRVLLVAGRPGSGRTSLAVRLARGVSARYRDGVLFARLTDHDGAPRPASRVAAELLRGLPWAADGTPREEPVAALRAALTGRRCVLVLDDAVHADQVLPLLPPGRDCLVVATSARPLPGVPDVRPCTLGGLDPAAGVDLLAHTIGEIRVTVDPTAARTLSEVCEGNPAALRLMGGWLAARPGKAVPDAVRALREAEAGDRRPDPAADKAAGTGRPPGAATAGESAANRGEGAGAARGAVAARAFRLVHDSLPTLSARILRLLALAPGGLVDPHVASALAGSTLEQARETLADFAEYGLLRPDPAGYRVPGWLAPLLRALAGELERPAEIRLARARMLERTVRLSQSCRVMAVEPLDPVTRRRLEEMPRVLRFASRVEAVGWLRSRMPELLAAARAAVADGELDTLARRLIASLVRTLDAYEGEAGPTPPLYELHLLLLEIAERHQLPRDRAAALINLADLDTADGRIKEALVRYRAALDAARAGDDSLTAGRALEALGGAYLELGDRERAADWYGRALALRQTRGELPEVARLHVRLGVAYRGTGRFGTALREFRAAAAAYRRLRDASGYATALTETARVQQQAGHPEEALRTGQEALQWARQAADAHLEGVVLLRMADLLERMGDPAGARLQREAAGPLLAGVSAGPVGERGEAGDSGNRSRGVRGPDGG